MVVGLVASILIGWLVGGIGNWLADQLPHLPERTLRFDAARTLRAVLRPWDAHRSADAGADVGAADEARPWRTTLLNGGMAVAFAIGWWRFGDDLAQLLVIWFYTVWLLVVLVIDFEHRRVLNLMLPWAVGVALLAPLFTLLGWAALPTYGSTLLGGLAGFLTFVAIFIVGRGRMMGAGDVKLAGIIGLMVGYPMVWASLASGIFLGGLAAIFLLAGRRAGAKSYMAYGPYLALGALLNLWIYWPF